MILASMSTPLPGLRPDPARSWTWPELLLWPLGSFVAASAWIAMLLAWGGRFAPGGALAGGGLVAALVLGRAWRGGRLRVTALRADRSGAATLLLALGLTAAQVPAGAAWPAALDAGWYLDSAAWIQRSRSLAFLPAAIAALPEGLRAPFVSSFDDQAAVLDPERRRFPASRVLGFHAVSLAVDRPAALPARPYHPPLLAAALALGLELRGAARAGEFALLAGLLWLLAIAVLARRLGGGGAAAGAVALAGSGPAFAYYAGQPFAEPAASAALLAGLALLHRSASGRGQALAAGLCLGLAGLVKVDALVPVALALALGAWWLRPRRTAALHLGLGALPGLGTLALLLAGPSQVYARLNGGGILKLAAGTLGPAAGAILAALLLALVLAWRNRERWPALMRSAGTWGALLVTLVALAQVQLWLPETGQRAPTMLAIAIWLLTPLGFWLAVMGLVEGGRAPDAPAEAWVPLAVLGLSACFTVLAPLVSMGLSPLYAGRRLLLAGLPLAAILAGQVLARPWAAKAEGWTGRALSAGGLLLLLGSLALAAAPFRGARGRDLSGGLGLIRQLAAATPAEAVIVFPSVLDGRHAGRLAAPLEALEGRATAVLGRAEPVPMGLGAALAAWDASGRPLYWAADDGQEPPEVPGWRFDLERDLDIVTRHLAPRPELPPTMATLPLALDLYRLRPDPEAAP